MVPRLPNALLRMCIALRPLIMQTKHDIPTLWGQRPPPTRKIAVEKRSCSLYCSTRLVRRDSRRHNGEQVSLFKGYTIPGGPRRTAIDRYVRAMFSSDLFCGWSPARVASPVSVLLNHHTVKKHHTKYRGAV